MTMPRLLWIEQLKSSLVSTTGVSQVGSGPSPCTVYCGGSTGLNKQEGLLGTGTPALGFPPQGGPAGFVIAQFL